MLNEFRQDPVSGDWVLFAPVRGKRPGATEKDTLYQTKEECVFEPDRLAEQEKPVAAYAHGVVMPESDLKSDWTTIVIPNKFPAVSKGICGPVRADEFFNVADGHGFHELVITRDHDRHFAQFTDAETAEVVRAYLDRYLAMAADNCGEYIQIFHNHGHLGGASVYHNHSQILSMPIVPIEIGRNIDHCRSYFEKTDKYLHQEILAWEMKEGKRIIFENEKFIALCPYASRASHEIRIFPKARNAYFGNLAEEDILPFAQALRVSIAKLDAIRPKVDYVFFIHTAPPQKPDEPSFDFYHWHVEIMPRFSAVAGLELGSNVFVNPSDPDESAAELRSANI